MSIKLNGPLLLAGAGNMGFALLSGWLERGLDPARVIVQDPAPPPRIKQTLEGLGIEVRGEVVSLSEPPAVILVAVKPQVMDQAFPPLAQLAGKNTVVLSVAAGRPINGFEAHLAPGIAVVRAMPNTPASVGRRDHRGRRQRAHDAGAARHLRSAAPGRWRSRLGRRRGPDGCRDRRVRLGAGLRVLSRGVPGRSRRRRRAPRRSWLASLPAGPLRGRASCCIARTWTRRCCARTSLPPTARRLRPCRC